MERLADLPAKEDVAPTPQEDEVMKKFFDAPQSSGSSSGKTSTERGWGETLKLALYAAIIFFALANPWVDSVFCMVPYCGGSVIALLLIKMLLFAMIFVIVYKSLF